MRRAAKVELLCPKCRIKPEIPYSSLCLRDLSSRFPLRSLSHVCLSSPLLTAAFAQIFSHLLPIDLLNLARTSKSFRTLLMSRSSRTLWRVSRQLVDGLPECPEHLSEPAYANLVFSNHCHVRSVPAYVYATRL